MSEAPDPEAINQAGFEAFSARAVEDAPVTMLNLLRFKPEGGRERYEEYGAAVAPLLERAGARVAFLGESAPALLGKGEWDLVLLVEYPTRQAFLEMIGSAEYQAIGHLRTEALEEGELHPTERRLRAPPDSAAHDPAGRQPLSVRLLGAGVRSARSVGKATGIDQAIEVAAEEAMVAAVESEAVERAIARVLQGPVVEEAMNSALESDAVKRALIEALDSELVDEVWRRLLASDEAQRLVERIAEAPEIRAAISAQSVGLIEDVGHTIGNGTRRLDGVAERIVRRIFFRKRRTEPTDRAGAVTRGARLRARRADRQPRLLRPGRGGGADRLGLHRQRQRRLQLRPGGRHDALVRPRRPLPGRLLVAGGADPGHALRRDQARRRGARPALRALGQAPDRDGAGGDPLRPRLPRHLLRPAAPGLGRPA